MTPAAAPPSAILVVDDEESIRTVLQSQISRLGHEVVLAKDGEAALELIRARDFALVITDVKMPRLSGLDLLRVVRAERPDTPVVLLTAHGSIETAVEAMKQGAYDFLTKPFDRDDLKALVEKAVRVRGAREKEPRGAPEGRSEPPLGRSPRMRELERIVERAAASPSTVLVTGETGTGKELVARALHEKSARRELPFVVQNCGALPDNLIESELFGHEKGSFTGAQVKKPGRIEIAHGGTFFLDEVGEIPLALQTRLLRVLEDGLVLAVGALRPTQVDVRWIAATNRDLKQEVAAGRFREDLYFRLRVIEVKIPPLRERLDDLADLAQSIRARLSARLGRAVPPVSPAAMDLLRAHDFPGNVRELENLLERAAVLASGQELAPEDFPDLAPPSNEIDTSSLKGMARAVTSAVEKREIETALEANGGNVTRTAEALGVSRRGLQNKMKEYGIRRKPE